MQFGEHASLATPMWEARDTSVRAIAAHLATLWDPPARLDERGDPIVTEKGLPHARASVLNLIVTVNDDAAADRIVRTLLDLGVRHPSRAIVLVPQHGSDSQPLDARISTHCHETAGDDGERMCYEEVILTVRGEAADHLSGIVAPLLIHDLPTHVWWPGDPPFNDPVFDQLVEMGDRVLFDSSDFVDLLGGLRRLGSLAARQRRRRPHLGTPGVVAGADRAVLRRAALPALPAEPQPPPDQLRRPAARCRDAARRPERLGARRHRRRWPRPSFTPAGSRRASAGGGTGPSNPCRTGRFQLTLEGRHEMIELAIRPEPTAAVRAGELMSVRLRSLGETGAAEFIIDRTGDVAVVATNADGMTALLRRVAMETPREAELLERPAHRRRRRPRLRERPARGRDHSRVGARERGVIDLDVRDSADAVAREAANRFIAIVADAIERQGIARVALSGGSTPKRVCPLLLEPARRDAVDWSAVEFFWGDERAVPPDHPESNFGVAYFMLISQLPNVRPDRVHRMQAEAPDLDAAALAYETELRLAFGVRGDIPPAFDLIWLGMGSDGHTASLFPGSPALDETERWVVPSWAPAREEARMTLTFPVLNAARETIFVVNGADKADALARVRSGDTELPAARVTGPAVHWIVDAAAAAQVA